MKQQAICELCMQAFEKRSANQKYCTECGVEMRKQQHREIIKNSKLRKTAARNYNKPDTLEEKCKKINLYNKRHGTPTFCPYKLGLMGADDCRKDGNCVKCWNQPIEE